MIAAFTGHRPQKLGGYRPNPVQDAVRAAVRKFLREYEVTEAISGMALGVDQWAAEECVALGIPFVAAVPFEGQDRLWPEQSRAAYRELLVKAVRVVAVVDHYDEGAFQVRNEWMVDHCEVLCAVWDGSNGGTGNCVAYARAVRRELYRINPRELSL